MRIFDRIAVALVVALSPVPAFAAPPPDRIPPLELLFRPIAPCRAFDTRAGAPIPTAGEREFFISGTALASQGGSRNGCGVPTYATAVQLTLSTTNAVSAGYALAYGANSSRPTIVGTAFRDSALASASSVTPIGLVSGNRKVSVYTTKQAHVIGDVTGYYAPQIAGMIGADGGIYSGTPALISSTRSSIGSYVLTVDRDVTFCAVKAQSYSYGNLAHAYLFNGKTVSVYSYNRNADGIITRVDDYVYVSITC